MDGATANLLTVALADPAAVPMALAALADAGIAAADGADFGAPGLIRLASTADDTVLDAIEQLATMQAGGLPPVQENVQESLSR